MSKLIEERVEIQEEEYRAVFMNMSSVHSLAKTKSIEKGLDPVTCGIIDDRVVQIGSKYYATWSRFES